MDRHVLSGTPLRRSGAGPVRNFPAGGVPVPGGAVRELVGAVLGDAGGSARGDWRSAGDLDARPGERRLLSGGPVDGDRPVGEKRHSDRRVRQ